eukprot:gene23661-19708_t
MVPSRICLGAVTLTFMLATHVHASENDGQCKNNDGSDKYEEIKSSNNKGGYCRFKNGAEPSEDSDYTKHSRCDADCCLHKCNAEAACTGFEVYRTQSVFGGTDYCEIHTGDLQTVKPNNGAECFKRCTKKSKGIWIWFKFDYYTYYETCCNDNGGIEKCPQDAPKGT